MLKKINMAHGIKNILIKKNDELECNNNQHNINNSNKMARNNLLIENCCLNPLNGNLLSKNKNSSSTNTHAMISTHQTLPPTQPIMKNNNNNNKLTLNCGATLSTTTTATTGSTKMGSRRIFTPQFKLQVLESYRIDNDCKGNQRATARKYGIHRRQIQKWLQCEDNLKSIIANNPQNIKSNTIKILQKATAPILSSSVTRHRVGTNNLPTHIKEEPNGATYSCFTLPNAKTYKNNNNVPSSTKCLTSPSSYFNNSLMTSNPTAIEATTTTTTKCFPPSRSEHLNNYNNTNYIYYENVEDLPIDLSCNGKTSKTESAVARLEGTYQQHHHQHHHHAYVDSTSPAATSLPPHFTDISNSYLKPELRLHPIDLSVQQISHKRKHSLDEGTSCSNNSDNKKPIKLFKPYLEENFDCEIVNEAKQEPEDENKQNFPLIWSNHYNVYHEQQYQPPDFYPTSNTFLINSSNGFYDSQALSPVTRSPSTLSSPLSGAGSNSYYTLMPPSQASPVSGYDSSTSSIYSFNDNDHEVSQVYSSGHYDVRSPVSSATTTPHTEIEVPLSTALLHDLKFKLHALDCYYNDASCKRNEKLVANKLNINCKIIEKWLRQENDLRHQQQQHHLQILV